MVDWRLEAHARPALSCQSCDMPLVFSRPGRDVAEDVSDPLLRVLACPCGHLPDMSELIALRLLVLIL